MFPLKVRQLQANNYLYKVNNKNIRKRCEICSKLTIKTLKRSGVFNVDFEQVNVNLAGFFCTFHLPLCLHFRYFVGVVVINCKVFVQLSAYLAGFYHLFQQFTTLNSRDILLFEFL